MGKISSFDHPRAFGNSRAPKRFRHGEIPLRLVPENGPKNGRLGFDAGTSGLGKGVLISAPTRKLVLDKGERPESSRSPAGPNPGGSR